MADRVTDFIAALKDEIEAVKKNKAGSTRLTGGTFIGQSGDNWLYSFTSARIFAGEDDAPVLLEVEGQRWDCSLVSSGGLQVQVAVPTSLGPAVASASLSFDRSKILVRLVEKLGDGQADKGKIFQFAEQVFSATSKPMPKAGGKPQYTFQDNNAPNSSQAKAIVNSFANSLAVIWGPPGTGKTRTIARAVEAHLKAGRRVLLVSHANTAVDAALEDIAAQLEDTYYAEGKIIRLGVPKNPNLPKQYPLVMPDKVLAKANAHLLRERDRLEALIKPLEDEVKNCKMLKKAADLVRKLEREIQRPIEATTPQQRYQNALAEIARAQTEVLAAQSRSDAAARETQIRDLNIFISSRRQYAREMEEKLENLASIDLSKNEKLVAATAQLDLLIESTRIPPNDVGRRIDAANLKLKDLYPKLKEIESAMGDGARTVIAKDRVVGTTLTKLFLGSLLTDQEFDILIVDEASMVPMPHLYWALSKASTGVTLVGDFNQLPPIVLSNSDIAKKWLGESIFEQLDISTVTKARESALVSMLDTQYRMAPEIAAVSSDLFYGGLLKSAVSTKELGFSDSVFGKSRIVVVDTSQVDPWCTRLPEGSRINLYSAGLAIALSQRLLKEHPEITVGVATPYRPQAELVAKAVNETGFGERALVSTVHRFQGGECRAIIFDCVDGKGSGKSMLNDLGGNQIESVGTDKSIAGVLLNVALTRARDLFVLLVNKQYFFETQQGSILCKFINELSNDALTINSRQVDNGFIARRLEDAVSVSPRDSNPQAGAASSVFNEKDFWSAFRHDLGNAQQTALIVSPFLTVKRSRHFIEQFKELVAQGINLSVYTRPIDDHTQDYMVQEARTVVEQLEQIGVTVIQRPKIHQKIVIIDDQICWEGSLNILSHRDSLEHMRRLEGQAIASEVRRNLRLN